MPMDLRFKDEFHIEIAPVDDHINRPKWSVVIPTYNCADYLRETLTSVLRQNYASYEMEIIVVDDCSTKDNPKGVVEEFKNSKIKFFQHHENVGKSKNYSKGLSMSTGHFIHLLHGDDTVIDGFYQKMETLFNEYPTASAAFCRCNYINADNTVRGISTLIQSKEGIVKNFQYLIAIHQQIQPPSIVFRREVYETIGTYDNRLTHIEDWEFYVRASLFYSYCYTPEILANYRTFDENSSSKSFRGGRRLKKIDQVNQIIDDYLPMEVKTKISRDRKKAEVEYLLLYIPKFIKNKDYTGYSKTMFRILRNSPSIRLVLRAFKLSYRSL